MEGKLKRGERKLTERKKYIYKLKEDDKEKG